MIFSNLGVRERRHQLRKFYTLGHLFGEIEPRSSFETGNKPFLGGDAAGAHTRCTFDLCVTAMAAPVKKEHWHFVLVLKT